MRKIKKKSIKDEQPKLIDEGTSYSAKSIIIMILIMAIVLVAFYFITVKVVDNKETPDIDETTVSEEYQSEKILFGQMLTRKEKEYYVYAYDEKSKMFELYEKYLQDYENKEDKLPLYRVDLNAGMNKEYVSDKTVINDSLEGLKVSGITLFKITDGKIEAYYTNSEDIAKILKG